MADDAPEFTAFLYDGWEPNLAPADPRRAWMDATPHEFAYRCLPIAVANSHGWHMPSPCTFLARWNGRADVGGLEFAWAPDAGPVRPSSVFGSGVITWHTYALLRTPPGWNLWVSGPANSVKDGIAPLSALVESDWMPFSFTMNWRFTRPNHWVRFDKGEPVMQFFPVPRAGGETMRARYRSVDEDPDLKRQYSAWDSRRRQFHLDVARDPPKEQKDSWQKDYFRGLDADGKKFPEHQTKARFPQFISAKKKEGDP